MNVSSPLHRGLGQKPTIAFAGRYQTRRTCVPLYVSRNASPTLRFPSLSVSSKPKVALCVPFNGLMEPIVIVFQEYVALYAERGRTRVAAETTTRLGPLANSNMI